MRIERPSRFENAIGQMEQLTHGRYNHLLGQLALSFQPLGKGRHNRIMLHGAQGGHIECGSQFGSPLTRNVPTASNTAARVMAGWIETDVSDQLTHIVEGRQGAHFRYQTPSSQLTTAADRAEQVGLLLQIGMLLEMITCLPLDLVHLLTNEGDMFLQLYPHQWTAGCLQTVQFLLLDRLEATSSP